MIGTRVFGKRAEAGRHGLGAINQKQVNEVVQDAFSSVKTGSIWQLE